MHNTTAQEIATNDGWIKIEFLEQDVGRWNCIEQAHTTAIQT